MKYEMIFGDEKLFDGAPDDAEYAGWFCQEIRWYMILNGKILFSDGGTWCTSDNPYLSADIAAMRRIIKTPKRWTWEDKRAGWLPEVGCNVSSTAYGYVCSVVAIDSNSRHIWCQFPDQSVGSCMIFEINPIETPAEKAQREEDEFIDSLKSVEIHDGTVSSFFNQGARAAYRKLKGGE